MLAFACFDVVYTRMRESNVNRMREEKTEERKREREKEQEKKTLLSVIKVSVRISKFYFSILTKIDREIFLKLKFAVVILETALLGKAPRESRRDNELCYISISPLFLVYTYICCYYS